MSLQADFVWQIFFFKGGGSVRCHIFVELIKVFHQALLQSLRNLGHFAVFIHMDHFQKQII